MPDLFATRRVPRRCLAAAGACGLLALAPGVAHADDTTYSTPATQGLSFGPVKVKGYTMTGSFYNGYGSGTPNLVIYLDRTSGKTAQGVTIEATRHAHVDVKPDLSATADANLGSLGRLKLRFAPSGRTTTRRAPKGCTGYRTSTRSGSTTGSLRLVVDRSFFRTITGGKFKASASRTTAGRCTTRTGPPPRVGQETTLYGSSQEVLLNVVRSSKGGVTQSVTQTVGQDPSIQRGITVYGAPASTFTLADDLSSGRVTGFGPALSGRLDFAASDRYTGGATGKLTGDLTARFVGVPPVRLAPNGLDGSVSRPGFVPPDQPPTADFSSSSGPGANDVQFFDNSRDPDGSIARWSWSFGDGASSTGSNPTHTYAGPGTYSVTETVTDDRGATSSVTKQVTVSPPPPSSDTGASEGTP